MESNSRRTHGTFSETKSKGDVKIRSNKDGSLAEKDKSGVKLSIVNLFLCVSHSTTYIR